MTNLTNGIYRIKDNTGEFAANIAIQIRDGKGRPMRMANGDVWGYAREEFTELSAQQIDALATYGLHENQATAFHSA